MRFILAFVLLGAWAAVLPAQPRAEGVDRFMANAGRLAEEGAGLAAELAKRAATAPGTFDLARYDRLNRQALEGLEIAGPSLRPTLEGRRLASEAGLPSDLVSYRIEMAGTGPFSALHAYLARLAVSLGGGRAQLESLRLEAAGGGQVRFTALYAVPHFEPFEEGEPQTGDLAEVIRWLEAQNERRRLSIKLFDQLAASARPRDLADGLAALGRAVSGLAESGGLAISKLEAAFISVRIEGALADPARLSGLEELFAAAGFYGVELRFPSPAAAGCPTFTAGMRLGRIERSESAAAADILFAPAAELCRPPAAAEPAPTPGANR